MVTGLAFDLPYGRWTDDVLRLRSLYEPSRLQFPIEITVVGSSGLGWFSEGQAQGDLLSRVSDVARGFGPFAFRFAAVRRFPNSSVYYLAPDNAVRFHAFQNRLAGCGLRFEPTPHAYVPHCTIADLGPDAATATHAEVAACAVPDGEIRVASVSFWSVDHARLQSVQGARVSLGA